MFNQVFFLKIFYIALAIDLSSVIFQKKREAFDETSFFSFFFFLLIKNHNFLLVQMKKKYLFVTSERSEQETSCIEFFIA